MTIGANIKKKRIELGLTLEEVAKAIGTSKQTIQRYETGVIANIPSDKVEKLAQLLGVSPGYLMGWEDSSKIYNDSSLYKKIEELCKQNHTNITQMCRDAGVSRGSMTDLKSGRIKSLSLDSLSKIASLFKCELDYFTDKEDSNADLESESGETATQIGRDAFDEIENPDLRTIARVASKMTPEQIAQVRRMIEALYPSVFDGENDQN